MRKRNKSKGDLTEIQKEIITGSMLGDGCISFCNDCNSIFCKNQKASSKEHLEWLELNMEPFSKNLIEIHRDKIVKYIDHEVKQVSCNMHLSQYVFKTGCDKVFSDLEKDWYKRNENGDHLYRTRGKVKERIKIIPKNLSLTPLAISIWYADDGSNYPKTRHVVLCTDSFQLEEVEYLITKLTDFDIKSYPVKQKNGFRICVASSSYLDFINLIKPYFVWRCFDYKINLDGFSPSAFKPAIKQSNVAGVNWCNVNQNWHVRIKRKGKTKNLGRFTNLEEAILVRKKAEILIEEENDN